MASIQHRLEAQAPGISVIFKTVAYVLGLVATAFVLKWTFDFIQAKDTPRLMALLAALTVGVGGTWFFFALADHLIGLIPVRKVREALMPFIFVGPATLLLVVYLVYPTLQTIFMSFLDARSQNFVGLENYIFIFTSPDMHVAFRNNLIWMVVATFSCVSLGLIVAVLVDRVRFESFAKALIFLPVAISSVGASVIWRFVYAYQPAGREQIGLLNALVTFFGGEPVAWMTKIPLNLFALIAILVWLQTGFCMVVLSAAIKNVPGELMEAARIDGANEFQLFFRITIPYVRGTIVTVSTTILIMVLKIFDIVYVMTRGHYDTEVIANRMYIEMFTFRNFGHGTALAVILFLAVVPAMLINVRNLRQNRS